MDKEIDALARLLSKRAMEVNHPYKKFIPGKTAIPVTGKVFGESEIYAALIASTEFWLTAGHFSEQFERSLANRIGMRHAAMVNSGSSANLVAMSSLTSPKLGESSLKPGDEVITVAA